MGKNEKAFYWLVLSIFEKGSQNAPSKKDKTFQETQYFDHDHLSNYFHQNMWIFIMWTPCMAKIAFYWLAVSIFEKKVPKMLHMRKAKLFRRPNIFIKSIHLIFFTKICGFPFFGHPACFFWKKFSQNAPYNKGKIFRRPNILITTIYLIFAPKYVDFHLLDTLYGWNSLLLIWSIHFWKKAPKMLNFRKAKLFRKPNILLTSIYPIFSTKICRFSFFGHHVWLE